MKVNHVSIYMGEDSQSGRRQSAGKGNQAGGGSIFLRDMLNGNFDPIGFKKQMAQKKALKVVSDAFAADRKLDQEIADREAGMKELRAERSAAEKSVRELETQKQEIGKEYGLGEEGLSDEDWSVLEKGSLQPETLTDEEKSRYEELEAQGLTEYYSRCQDIDDLEKPYRQIISENTSQIEEYQAANKAVHNARLDLKNNPMVAAQKEAGEIMEAARKEILGMLTEEGMNHIEEELQEKIEQAREAREKKEEQEEKLENIREEKAQLEDQVEATREKAREKEKRTEDLIEDLPMEDMLQIDGNKADFQQELKDIMQKMKLLEEDFKGTTVDQSL